MNQMALPAGQSGVRARDLQLSKLAANHCTRADRKSDKFMSSKTTLEMVDVVKTIVPNGSLG